MAFGVQTQQRENYRRVLKSSVAGCDLCPDGIWARKGARAFIIVQVGAHSSLDDGGGHGDTGSVNLYSHPRYFKSTCSPHFLCRVEIIHL